MPKEKRIGYSLKEVRDGAIYLYKFEPVANMYEREKNPSTGKEEWKRDEKGNKIFTPWFKEELDKFMKTSGITDEKEAIRQMDNRVKWKWTSCGRWNQKKIDAKTPKQVVAYNKVQSEKDAMDLGTLNRLEKEAFELEMIYLFDREKAQELTDKKGTKFKDELSNIRELASVRLEELRKKLGYTEASEAFRKERYAEARQFFKEKEEKNKI